VKYFLFTLFFYFFFIHSLSAQIYVELDSISVTASRISSDITESGKSVTVITYDEIRAMPVNSMDELFRSLPGVNINSRQGFGVQADVGIRGSTYSQVLFMLDNVPLNDPLTAHFNTNIPISLSEVGQIELIRGPAAASFGADAVGGVIHIKSRAYLNSSVSTTGNQGLQRLDVDLSGGENRLFMGDASMEYAQNDWRFTASVRSSQSDGEQFPNPAFSEGISPESTFKTDFNLLSLSAALSNRVNDRFSWYLRGGSDYRDFNARYFYTRSLFDESREEITSHYALGALNFHSGSHRAEINLSYRNVNDMFDFNSAISPVNEHTTQQLFFNLSHQVEIDLNRENIHSFRLMSGTQMLRKEIVSTDRGDHSDLTGGIYLISALGLENGLNVNTSFRLQFDEIGSVNFLPQVSVAYNLPTLTVRSSAGRAIRTGDYTERYISSEIPNLTPLRNIGNPDLKPEVSTTVDAGFDWRPIHRFSFSPTLFYRSSTNLIDYVLTNQSEIPNAANLQTGEDYFYTRNVAESSTAGFELLTTGRFLDQNSSQLIVQGGYTYIRTTNREGIVSRYIANHPSHQFSVGVRFNYSHFQIHSQNEYNVRNSEAARELNSSVPSTLFLSNLKVSFAPERSRLGAYLSIMNITDVEYQEILGAPMPGRWLIAGLQLKIRN